MTGVAPGEGQSRALAVVWLLLIMLFCVFPF